MTLCHALFILATVHTRDDDEVGFTVETLPSLHFFTQADYIEAWKEVRRAIGQQVDMASFTMNRTIPTV